MARRRVSFGGLPDSDRSVARRMQYQQRFAKIANDRARALHLDIVYECLFDGERPSGRHHLRFPGTFDLLAGNLQ